ncbi:MAG: DUF2062 domain-containing protein [Nitrospirota bacterium]|nr:DUF2062 domain-containing protein [Nitrospirota bacterium]
MTIQRPDQKRLSNNNREGWKERIMDLFLGSDDPVKDALSFATGFASAFLPPFGFHSILVALLAYVFKLSLPIGLLGSWMNNPWTFVPVFLPAYLAEIKVGCLLLHMETHLPNLKALSEMPKGAILAQIKAVLYPFLIGSTLFSVLAFFLSFPVVYVLIRWIKTRKARPLF